VKPQHHVALPAAAAFVALVIVLALPFRGADPSLPPNSGDSQSLPPPSNGAISPKDQADALHYVIAADREMYCREYMTHQTGDEHLPNAATGIKAGKSWPVPCGLIRSAAESIQNKGAEFSYSLRSLRPSDPRNEPQTELEQRGLAFVASHPTQNYYGQEMLGGRRYFTAVYPDLPAVASCVDCHNRRPASIPQRHQVGEILGGIVVRIPLEF